MLPLPISKADLVSTEALRPQIAPAPTVAVSAHTFPVILLMGLLVGILWYGQHRRHQCWLNQQREQLEKIWQMSASK